jgi:hypothetical protein
MLVLVARVLLYVGAGPALDVPHSVTPQQLEVLLNGLLQNEEKTPYSFYIEGQVGHWKLFGASYPATDTASDAAQKLTTAAVHSACCKASLPNRQQQVAAAAAAGTA